MDKEVNYSAGLQSFGTTTEDSNQPVDYMFHNPQQHQIPSGFCSSASLDKLSFAEVMRFADFGPKLALNQTNISEEEREEEGEKEEETGIDFLKFPVLNDKLQDESLMLDEDHRELGERGDDFEVRVSLGSGMQAAMNGENPNQKQNNMVTTVTEAKNKRKRPRTIKTSEEVESQRMTHIAVERNRRKQMNEHLRVLRSLMPGSYVQRGDQASIIGGAIEFVRELEQLLQCLESQKRRRLYGDHPPGPGSGSGSGAAQAQLPQPPPSLPSHQQLAFFPGNDDDDDDQLKQLVELEETAESKSCLADVEVKMLGFDAMIKILSRRRPGQLINTIAALQQDLQLNILHTNITTIEQTVLYTFNVKVPNDARFTAEDIAGSVQQIFTFIHANSGI